MEEDFQLYKLQESSGKCHSVLKVPKSLPNHYGSEAAKATSDIYNILMADISGSMWDYWPQIVIGWQEHVKEKLTGRTDIYCFGDLIKLKRNGTEITQADFTGDGTNDLTGALRTVRHKVDECPESNVRVFIIADGAHDHGEPYPETEICQMRCPPGKTICVFVLGLGPGFPVQHSIDIRSRMHNGNANVPYLFWGRQTEDIVDQLAAIGEELNSSLVKLNLNIEGCTLPGLEKSSVAHLGEWLYFETPPEELPRLTLSINDGDSVTLAVENKMATLRLFLDGICRQWNSVMIQQHRRKDFVPHGTFDLMESLFKHFWDTIKQEFPEGKDIKSRLTRKNLKSSEVEFRTLMNQSKLLINTEEKFSHELELAEAILKTTVTNRKYDTKNLRLRGHSQEDFDEDMKAFKNIYEKAKPSIMALDFPDPDDCCRVTITSTLIDLQDPDFLLMTEENKFDFMRNFTVTGIPVYAPVRDASQINPWVMVIKHILVTPFTILSQTVLESSAAMSTEGVGVNDRDIILQQDNEKTRFNAIIPIVPASAAEVMKPLVLSNIYAMLATFSIMKNPHIIDHNAHIAALGCVWIRTIGEFPLKHRPEFARDRVECILATARLYMDRPTIKSYVNALINKPKLAIMTESDEEYDGRILKCESLVKPTFFVYLRKEKMSEQQVTEIFKLLLREFVGRCLTSYKNNDPEATPFTDFFCVELGDAKNKKAWLEKNSKTIIDNFQQNQGNFLEKFFTLDDLIPTLSRSVSSQVLSLQDRLLDDLTIAVNMEKVKKLKNPSGCGEVRWSFLQAWAQEMGIPEQQVEDACSPSQVLVYVSEALRFRNSKERLSRELSDAESVMELIKKNVVQESSRDLRRSIGKEVEELVVKQWRQAYSDAHRALVMPLTKEQIVEEATLRGINVSSETFSQLYRYNEHTGLLRNACQIKECPHYLHPHNNFNQHISIEREGEEFPHALHLVSSEFRHQELGTVIEKVTSGKFCDTRKRKPPAPIKSSSLDYLRGEIEALLKVYQDNESFPRMNRSTEEEDEDDEEFHDCLG